MIWSYFYRGTSSNPPEAPFREAFAEIGKLRASFQKPFLCLTATANRKTRFGITSLLHLNNVNVVKLSPENMNTKLIMKRPKYEQDT